jgi:hypothetical protein
MESAQTPRGISNRGNSRCRSARASAQVHGIAVIVEKRREQLSRVGRHDMAPAVYGARANPDGFG